MIVKLDDEIYRVHFHHDTKRDKKANGRTTCIIECIEVDGVAQEPPVPTGHATAVAMKPDVFSKSVGRRVSLQKALIDWDYPRADRKLFWAVYTAQCADFKR